MSSWLLLNQDLMIIFVDDYLELLKLIGQGDCQSQNAHKAYSSLTLF